MNPRVIAAKAESNYRLRLQFGNGERRVFSVVPYLQYPIYQALKNESFFGQVSVFNGTVCWGADGEIDFDPDTLYLESIETAELAA